MIARPTANLEEVRRGAGAELRGDVEDEAQVHVVGRADECAVEPHRGRRVDPTGGQLAPLPGRRTRKAVS